MSKIWDAKRENGLAQRQYQIMFELQDLEKAMDKLTKRAAKLKEEFARNEKELLKESELNG